LSFTDFCLRFHDAGLFISDAILQETQKCLPAEHYKGRYAYNLRNVIVAVAAGLVWFFGLFYGLVVVDKWRDTRVPRNVSRTDERKYQEAECHDTDNRT